MTAIRVVIADDHAILRAGLRMLLEFQPDIEVVGEASDGEQALAKVREQSPDVVTVDLVMPGTDSMRTIEQLRHECPATRVLVLTMRDDPAYLRASLAAGASGYVVKTAADTELLSAIRAVHEGRTFVNISWSDVLLETLLGSKRSSGEGNALEPAKPLSEREQEVLTLLAQGYTNQETADRLFLSVKTIETYRARLMAKLHLESRADLVRYAAENGLWGRDKFIVDKPR